MRLGVSWHSLPHVFTCLARCEPHIASWQQKKHRSWYCVDRLTVANRDLSVRAACLPICGMV